MKLTDEVRSMAPTKAMRILRAACVLALIGLAMMIWSLVDPKPAPILLALSFGQLCGTLSFVAFLSVVAWDIYQQWKNRPARKAPGSSEVEPPKGDAA